jgi:hypothetical protein
MARYLSCLFLIFTFIIPNIASAQATATPQSFDQYPSFIELTSATNDGGKVVLRCGYSSPNGQVVSLDPSFHELSILNESHKSYSRIQHIDNFLIATSSDPTGGPGLLLELIKPDSSVTAKNCQTDLNTDTIGNCHSIQPFTFANQLQAGDQKIEQQCADMMRESGAKINASLASVPKTESFKATLRQKIAILAAP